MSVKLDMDDAIPCGLIIQELLSNSMKHAFPDGTGEIRIEFHDSCGELKLCYRDNGIGLRPDLDLKNPQSPGSTTGDRSCRSTKGTFGVPLSQRCDVPAEFPSQHDRMRLNAETVPKRGLVLSSHPQ